MEPICPDVILYVCTNSIPPDGRLPRQWHQGGAHVLVRQVPCSGKMDLQYLFHALEGGARGLCVIACPKGQCQLSQGNYRAEVRIGTIRRLLTEIGIEPERVELLHLGPDESFDRYHRLAREAVGRICALGPSPLAAQTQPAAGKR